MSVSDIGNEKIATRANAKGLRLITYGYDN